MRVERLTTSDLAMLVPDEVGWPQDIAAIAILEGASLLDPRGRVRIDMIRQAIERRLHLVPRFRQLLVDPPKGLGVPYWTDAPHFDIADHVRVMPLPPGADERQLFDAFETLRARRFDRRKPLWELWLLPGLAGGNVGLVVKLHHTVADGMAGVATFAMLLDVNPDAAPSRLVPWQPRPLPTRRGLFADNLRRRLAELLRPLRALLHPVRLVRTLRRVTPMVREVVSKDKAPTTSLAHVVGKRRRVDVVRSRLDVFKAIGHAHGAKVNDVLLAIVASGLRTLLLERGDRVDNVVLRAAVPISQHGRSPATGNNDSGMIVRLPIGGADDIERLVAIARDTELRKRQPRPAFGGVSFPGVRGVLRHIYAGMGHQRIVNTYAANVPGPPVPLYLAGAKLLEIFPIVPLTGNTPLSVGALSYTGQLAITIVSDPDACPDVDGFVAALRSSLDALAAESHAHAA